MIKRHVTSVSDLADTHVFFTFFTVGHSVGLFFWGGFGSGPVKMI